MVWQCRKGAIRPLSPTKGAPDGSATPYPTPRPHGEEAIIVLFCLVDEAYRLLNPRGERYASLKRLSDSEVIAIALFQQLRGVQSEQSFLREAERFFSHLFPGVVGGALWPSSLNRRLRKLRRFLEPLQRALAARRLARPSW